MPKTTINVSSGTIFRVIFIILFLAFLFIIRDILLLLFFAVIIASAIDLPAKYFDKLRIPRVLSVLLIYLICIGLLAGLFILFIPSLSQEMKTFSTEFPEYINNIYQRFQQIQAGSIRYQRIIREAQSVIIGLGETLKNSTGSILSGTFNVFGGLVSFIIVLIISFYLAVQKNGIQKLLRSITPRENEAYVLSLWSKAQLKMAYWFQGQLFLAVAVGVLVYIGLSLLDIRFAFLLAFIAGLLELVPYIGPVLSGIPAVLLAFFQSPALSFWVLILYIVVQQLENYILVPLIMKKFVGLNPVVVIISLLIGGKLFGILGLLLAVPTAAILAEFFRELQMK